METREHLVVINQTQAARERAERQLSSLATAVRDHEARMRAQLVGPRAHDLALYRRLRQIAGEL
jgi:hypothetical protein